MNWLISKMKGDIYIWLIVLALSFFSVLAVYSSSGTLAYKFQGGNTEYYLIKHFLLLGFGLFIMYVVHLIHYRFFYPIATVALILSIPLLIFTYFLGLDINEARRWIMLPGINLTFQTSDFAKLALIMFVAKYLSSYQDNVDEFKTTFLPLITAVGFICGLIAPADFSTAGILFLSALMLMFIGRIQLRYIGSLIGLGVVGLGFIVLIGTINPDWARVKTWEGRFDSFLTEDGGSYQNRQAKIAIAGSGLVWGKGPGNSTQRNFLPNPFSDFIFAIVIEEYGILFGGGFLIFLYLALVYRTIIIVMHSPHAFGALLAAGLSFSLAFQALVNMAVTTHLLPATGLPLPIVSMGGTSLWFTSISLGIILSVSKVAEEGKLEKTEKAINS